MPRDYDSLDDLFESDDDEDYKNNDDFPSICTELLKSINWKVAFFLYLISILIFSDLFSETMLTKDSMDGDCPNTKGTMIQITVLVLCYLVLDLIVQGGFL